ncbi:trypsin-like peptidase domain-containing protein [Filibacter tadaridae]|uniref:Serine protease HhoA n=1 Tax=Filibacter tadaridae TaxID=2483811 RepID=A0A3P5WZY5_9BACL|nr:trypsin-like peptidase domain-containing protein [Filibacter tadaridae]VDC23916.1 Putative serine protease HhoA precursor [Filibacter tadaridae]
MDKRSNRHQKENKSKKSFFVLAASIVLLFVVCLGTYALLKESNRSEKEYTIPASFEKKIPESMEITNIDEKLENWETEPGTVTYEDTTETVEKVEVVEMPVAPERDMATIIANAQSHVYTLYTDLQQGSGFLFNTKGDIVTNAHVVKDASYVTVKNNLGQEFNGQVIGISEEVDIALVRVEELVDKKPLQMEMSEMASGTDVIALGSPENISNSSSEGKITATGVDFYEDYTYLDLYEMNATIKPGSSGGPLVDKNTERVIGVNSIILTDNPKIGYAIPMYTIVDQLYDWAANPLKGVNWEENFENQVEDARLDDEMIRNFIESYYELVVFSLNDKAVDYYTSYILPDSQAATEAKKLIDDNVVENRVYSTIETTVNNVEIGNTEAVVDVTAYLTYHDEDSEEVFKLTQEVQYTVLIDEFGDYQIKEISKK